MEKKHWENAVISTKITEAIQSPHRGSQEISRSFPLWASPFQSFHLTCQSKAWNKLIQSTGTRSLSTAAMRVTVPGLHQSLQNPSKTLHCSTTEHGAGTMDWPLCSFWKIGTIKGHDNPLCVPCSCECFAFWFTAVSRWEAHACTVQKKCCRCTGFCRGSSTPTQEPKCLGKQGSYCIHRLKLSEGFPQKILFHLIAPKHDTKKPEFWVRSRRSWTIAENTSHFKSSKLPDSMLPAVKALADRSS